MLFDIIKIILFATVIAFPFALINGLYFHNKADPRENPKLFVVRIIFSVAVGLFCSLLTTHLTLSMKSDYDSWSWIFYPTGFFLCIPYFMSSLAKESRNVDHVVDGFGIIAAVSSFVSVIAFWEQFFVDTENAGILYKISDWINNIQWDRSRH